MADLRPTRSAVGPRFTHLPQSATYKPLPIANGFGGVVYGVSFRGNQPIVEVSKLSIEKRIQELGRQLPKVPVPAANYTNAVRMGNAIYLSGTVPARPDGTIP